MALSQQTLDYLLEAESSIRSGIKCAAVNENPLVVTQVSKLLMDIEHIKSGIACVPGLFTINNIKYPTNQMMLNNHACLQKYFLTAIDLRISGALSCDLKICSIINAMIVAITKG